MQSDKHTSLISIISTEHAKLRREQRDIDKRDLQRALKFGTKKRCYRQRWMLEYDGIIFILDTCGKREITAYPAPLKEAPIDIEGLREHNEAKFIIQHKPTHCASHTVLVVDNSGSMQTHDIPLHRDRQVAAYSTMAMEYIATQIFTKTANNRDVISLVEFDETARVIFTREPCTWVLYNKLLSRREARGFKCRQDIKQREVVRADSNYLPALDLADQLLAMDHHDECALGLLFFSDGEPSDARQYDWTPLHARSKICTAVARLATNYNDYLSMSMVGFGNADGDFSVLRAMVDTCNSTEGNARAAFVYCKNMTHTLGTALSSLASSVTELRTSLVGRSSHSVADQKRQITSESEAGRQDIWSFYNVLRHGIYGPAHGRLVDLPSLPPGAFPNEAAYLERPAIDPPSYLAQNGNSFGSGAERFAFRCFLSRSMDPKDFMMGEMVAKETILANRMSENAEFHETFCETQGLASYLADEFNTRLRAIPKYNELTTPKVTFLPCSLIVLDDHTVSGGTRSVLVEKMLDTRRHKWSKWNDNGGGVDGKPYHAPLDTKRELELLHKSFKKMDNNPVETILEEDSDMDDDSVGMLVSDDVPSTPSLDTDDGNDGILDVTPSEYMQAFSHFTYAFTGKKVLVCDLQGIFNRDMCPPTFELTDPAIHYRSAKKRKMVYGRTDKGVKGIDLFFATHQCTNLCKLVCLSTANNDWQNGWHNHHGKKYGSL